MLIVFPFGMPNNNPEEFINEDRNSGNTWRLRAGPDY